MERGTDRIQVILYTRRDCCLCEEMKQLLQKVERAYPLDLAEVDIDQDPDLRERFGQQIPVIFIEGRKAFKYRTTELELRKRLDHALFMKQRFGGPPLP
ncbi:MAG: glutaredoxin family protein [Candidatus Methylomirabilales bacterium]